MSLNAFAWASVLGRTLAAHLSPFRYCVPSVEEEVFTLNAEGRGLIVLLHGYKQHRGSLMAQWATVEKAMTHPNAYRTLYVPHIHYEDAPPSSNLLCLESNASIFSTVQAHCEQHEEDDILIIGISLGGRIAIGLQHALRRAAERQHIHTITLASPLQGTSLVRYIPFASYFLGNAVYAELNPNSSQQLHLANIMYNIAPHRSFLHFYLRTDHLVFPPSRCVTVGAAQSTFCLSNCAHREVLTHPYVIHSIVSFLFPPRE